MMLIIVIVRIIFSLFVVDVCAPGLAYFRIGQLVKDDRLDCLKTGFLDRAPRNFKLRGTVSEAMSTSTSEYRTTPSTQSPRSQACGGVAAVAVPS